MTDSERSYVIDEDVEMDDIRYLAEWARIQPLILLVADIPVTEMLQQIGHIHTVAPILDPTAYRNGMGNLEEQEALLRGLAPFVKAARRVRERAVAAARDSEEAHPNG